MEVTKETPHSLFSLLLLSIYAKMLGAHGQVSLSLLSPGYHGQLRPRGSSFVSLSSGCVGLGNGMVYPDRQGMEQTVFGSERTLLPVRRLELLLSTKKLCLRPDMMISSELSSTLVDQ